MVVRVKDSTILLSATGLYVGTLIIANVTAGKLFGFAGVSISAGAFAYLACLATSDVIVDVYGPSIGYRLVRLASVMNLVALLFGQLVALRLPIAPGQEALQPHFAAVFDASAAVIVASIIGFPITDAFETYLWKQIKTLTRGRHLLLRNMLVKVPGQVLDATIFFTLARSTCLCGAAPLSHGSCAGTRLDNCADGGAGDFAATRRSAPAARRGSGAGQLRRAPGYPLCSVDGYAAWPIYGDRYQ
jgi:queuosine precursor transporter